MEGCKPIALGWGSCQVCRAARLASGILNRPGAHMWRSDARCIPNGPESGPLCVLLRRLRRTCSTWLRRTPACKQRALTTRTSCRQAGLSWGAHPCPAHAALLCRAMLSCTSPNIVDRNALQIVGEGFTPLKSWCRGHPDAATHANIAQQLIQFINAVFPGWAGAAA